MVSNILTLSGLQAVDRTSRSGSIARSGVGKKSEVDTSLKNTVSGPFVGEHLSSSGLVTSKLGAALAVPVGLKVGSVSGAAYSERASDSAISAYMNIQQLASVPGATNSATSVSSTSGASGDRMDIAPDGLEMSAASEYKGFTISDYA